MEQAHSGISRPSASDSSSKSRFRFSSRTGGGAGRVSLHSSNDGDGSIKEILAEKTGLVFGDRRMFFEKHEDGENGEELGRLRKLNRISMGSRATKANNTTEKLAEGNRCVALQGKSRDSFMSNNPINFYDIVDTDMETEAASTDFSERIAGRITESMRFQNLILFCIILNTILAVIYTIPHIEQKHGRSIDQIDSVLLTIYVMEIGLKITYQKKEFWKDNWNLFDFILILVSMIGVVVRDMASTSFVDGSVLRFLRVMRAFRTLRILGALPKLQVVVNTFMKSLLELTNIVVLILLLVFMFSILGLELFKEYVPHYFGSLTLSAQSLFILITQDGWVAIYSDLKIAVEGDASAGAFNIFMMHAFFILFIVIGAWVFINMISGITVTNWQLYVDEMREMERQKFHEIEMPEFREGIAKDAKIVTKDTVDSSVWSSQVPLVSTSSLGQLSVVKLENYMLVVHALEQNLKEFQLLKLKLKEHLDIIQAENHFGPLEILDDDAGDDSETFDGDALSAMQSGRRRSSLGDSGSGSLFRRKSLLGNILSKS